MEFSLAVLAPLVNQPRGRSGLLWFARHGNSSLARTKNSCALFPSSLQCVYSGLFLFFNFYHAVLFFFHSVHSLARDDEEGSNRCRSNFGGGGWIFFVHFSLFVFQIRPISLPRMRLFTDILFWFRRGGDRGCACGIEFSENLRPGRVEEGCQGRGGRMNLAKAGDRFSGELVVRRRSCRWSS